MFKRMNDIHTNYLRKNNKLTLGLGYRYDFVNIETTGIHMINSVVVAPNFFVFATKLKSPFNTYIDIVPNRCLDVIPITYNQNCHFHYLRSFKLKENPYKVNENLMIFRENNEIFAELYNQTYYSKIDLTIHEVKKIKYLLLISAKYYNSDVLLPLNFSLQLKIIEKSIYLNSIIGSDEYEKLYDEIQELNWELSCIVEEPVYSPSHNDV